MTEPTDNPSRSGGSAAAGRVPSLRFVPVDTAESTREPGPRRLLLVLLWAFTVACAFVALTATPWDAFGLDSHAYWAATRGPLYDQAPATVDAYLYSPAFAQVTWPLAQLPWPAFGYVWSACAVVAFLYLFWPLGPHWALPLTACCLSEILTGNIFWLLALVAAHGFARPGLWAVPLLTKITPALGPVWFLVRREWRSLAAAVVWTLLVAGVSIALTPGDWRAWLDFLTDNATTDAVGDQLAPPLVVRLPVAVLLTAVASWKDRRWLVPVAMVVATPVAGIAALTMLAAIPRLRVAASTPAA